MRRSSMLRFCALAGVGLLVGTVAQGKDPKPAADVKKAVPSEAAPPVDSKANEEAIRAALLRPIHIDFVETPLTDVVAYVRDCMKIPIVLDKKALDEVGIVPDQTPLTLSAKGISARSALSLMLRPLELDWMITDEVLLITTRERTEMCLSVRVYEVGDLVLVRNEKDQIEANFDDLIDLITTTVVPITWDVVGGPGSIAPLKVGTPLLSVRQTDRAHEELEAFLVAVRKAAGKKIPDNVPKKIPNSPECQAGQAGSIMGPAPEPKAKPK